VIKARGERYLMGLGGQMSRESCRVGSISTLLAAPGPGDAEPKNAELRQGAGDSEGPTVATFGYR
jgi:hypothetical protein